MKRMMVCAAVMVLSATATLCAQTETVCGDGDLSWLGSKELVFDSDEAMFTALGITADDLYDSLEDAKLGIGGSHLPNGGRIVPISYATPRCCDVYRVSYYDSSSRCGCATDESPTWGAPTWGGVARLRSAATSHPGRSQESGG